MITGIPVAIANINGRYNPEALDMVKGTSMPKYNTPLYGQKARAKTIPSNTASINRHDFLFSIFSESLPKPGIFILMISSINIPINNNNGPMIFSPYRWKNPENLNWSAPIYIINGIRV